MTTRKPYVWSIKDPDEEYEYRHDWSQRLLVNGVDVGDAIRTAADPDPAKHPKAEVVEGDVVIFAIVPAAGGTAIDYWTRGGTLKSKIELGIWTTQNRHYVETIVLPIKEI